MYSVSGVLPANTLRYASAPAAVQFHQLPVLYAAHAYSVTQIVCSAAKFGCRENFHSPLVLKPRSSCARE